MCDIKEIDIRLKFLSEKVLAAATTEEIYASLKEQTNISNSLVTTVKALEDLVIILDIKLEKSKVSN